MASLISVSPTGFDEEKTFYDRMLLLDSQLKRVMDCYRQYRVYVHSQFIDHHYIVVVDKKGCCQHVTIELTVTDASDGVTSVAPRAQLYSGDSSHLVFKGEVFSTLENICEVAQKILVEMGPYHVVSNNCQHFCDKFLKEFGLPGHMTDTAKIGWGAAFLGGVFAAGYALYRYVTGSSNSDDKKRKGHRDHAEGGTD